jgi:hypothetical protein
MRRFLAGKVSVVEDGRMDGYYEEGEKYRNKRNYVPLVLLRPPRPPRPDLVGGGLVRSHGGWAEVKKSRSLIKGDERILGDTSFVMSILADAEQNVERRYAMRQAGIDLDAIHKRVCDLHALKPDDLYGQGRQKTLVEARSLFCFWAVRELGIPQKALAERFSLTAPAISYAVRRGQRIAREKGYKLLEKG